MKLWVIINCANYDDFWENTGIASGSWLSSRWRIPDDRRPKMIYEDHALAEAELLRLTQRNPRQQFLLFESVSEWVQVPGVKGGYRLEEVQP